jgi:hypothetical protein
VNNDRLRVNVVSNQNSVELTKSENKVVVTDKKQDTSVNVTQKETAVVTVASKGPKGDRGEPGDSIFRNIDGSGRYETVESVTDLDVSANFLVIGRSSFSGSVNFSGSLIPHVVSGNTSLHSIGSSTAAWQDVYVSRSLSFVNDSSGVVAEVFGGDEYIQLGNVRINTSSVVIYNQSNEVQTKISSEAPDFFIIKSGSFVAAQINSEGVMVLGKFDTPPTPVTGGMYYSSDGNFYLGM